MRSRHPFRSLTASSGTVAKLRTWCVLTAVSTAPVVCVSCGDDATSSGSDATAGGSGNLGGSPTTQANTTANAGAGAGADTRVNDDECDAKAKSLLGTQPKIGVRSKAVLTQNITWPSQVLGSTKACTASLQFKDLNGNGTLEPYEDWTKTAAERVTDLLGRMSSEQKMSLLLHPSIADAPTTSDANPSSAMAAMAQSGVRFGRSSANTSSVIPRSKWANNLQALCESSSLGIPFVLSSEPAHSSGNGRVKAKGFSQWPNELGLAAGGDVAAIENFGKVVAAEYRAIGISMALSPSADLFTDPRWHAGQFTFGEDSAAVAEMVAAYVRGLQGTSLGSTSVASVVGRYPGAGAAKGGWDGRLAKGKYLSYRGNNLDAHLAPFERAISAGAAGVMPAYGIPETGPWSGAAGTLTGTTIEQVGAAFNKALLTDALRGHSKFTGLVLAPWGILEDDGTTLPAAPWGVESLTKAQRLAKAVNAGVDQFGGLADATPIREALAAGQITQGQIDASAQRALTLALSLGLFENPYVDEEKTGALTNTDAAYRAGLTAMDRGMVLLINNQKPTGWLVGGGDGTQTGDKGNAGNGSLRVLPAPPGEPYVRAGCNYYVMGSLDIDYVTSVAAGYGTLTNSANSINGVPSNTAAARIALSDYVFIRIDAPSTADPDSGSFGLPDAALSYTSAQLADVAAARAAIDAWAGKSPASQAQIVVAIDGGRPPVIAELLKYGVSALYIQWAGSFASNQSADKVFLDVAFGIVNGLGRLPVGLPLSDAAMSSQLEDVAKDGQDTTFVSGFGLSTAMFQ